MALTWEFDCDDAIDFADAIGHFDALGAQVLERDLDRSAHVLRRLANNRRFLVEALHAQLQDLPAFERRNPYTPQVFMLHVAAHYAVRAAIWMPPAQRRSDGIFVYEQAHDHNFDLLTVGYLGPGYRTALFEYDHASTAGFVGESVPVRALGQQRLAQGRVMLYRGSRDIHVQFPCDDVSISLNVLSAKARPNRQFEFELVGDTPTTPVTRARIRRVLSGPQPALSSRLADALGVAGVPERLQGVVDGAADDAIGLAFAQALAALAGGARREPPHEDAAARDAGIG